MPRKKVEELRSVGPQLRFGRQEAEVRVRPRRGNVVIAGAEVDVAPQTVSLVPHDKRHLGVRLEPEQAVDDVYPLSLQGARPRDVVFLVEARLQLHEDGNLFAVLARVHERFDDGRVAADSVEGLLDGQDIGVLCSCSDEIDNRRKGVVGMMQEDILVSDGCEQIGSLAQNRRNGGQDGRIP